MANIYNVKNRSASMVIYRIPEENIRREFAPGEVKKISLDELTKLSYQSGGQALMANFLQWDDAVSEALNIPTEPEYYMSEEQVVELLKNGTYEAFLDCLDFAPMGVMDLVKKYAVELPLTDNRKIEALKEKTGFDVLAALKNVAADRAADEPEVKDTEKTTRRTTVNYKVVTPKTE